MRRSGAIWPWIELLGGTPAGVWTIKHVVAPLDLWLYRRSGGRFVTWGNHSRR